MTTIAREHPVPSQDATAAEPRAAAAAPQPRDVDAQPTFTVTSAELDLGGPTSEDGVPVTSAYLGWNPNDAAGTMAPYVSGYVHYVNAAGVRPGVQLSLYDYWGTLLSRDIERVPVVPTQDEQVSGAQFMFGTYASAHVHQANVSLVIEVTDPEVDDEVRWSWVAGRNLYLFEPGSPVRQVDLAGVDHFFGSEDADPATGVPTGPAYLSFFTNDKTVEPRVSGYLHAFNARNTKVGLRLTAYDRLHRQIDQAVLEDYLDVGSVDGHVGPHHVDWSPISDPRIHHVILALVIDNDGVWERLDRVKLDL